MSYLSTGASLRRLGPGARALMVGASAALTSLAAGVAVATFGWIALAASGALAGLWAVAFAPSFVVVGSVLVVRGLSDAVADVGIVAGLNGGALIGLLLIAGAILLVGRRVASGSVVGAGAGVVTVLGLGYWLVAGVVQHGVDASLLREFVRAASVLAVALLAANADRTLTARRLADIVVVAALLPAVLVLVEGVTQWQQVVGGDLRPRGTLSHPNAASILFGTAIPIAAWRWAYGGGGRRYLLAALLLGAAILLTRSIGGLAQVVVTLFVATWLLPGRGRERAVLGMATAGILAVFVFDPFGLSRISEIDPGALQGELDRHDSSMEWRLVNWGELMEEWREQPWLGHGLGSTAELVRPLGHLPHSDPVRFLVEGGVVGATLLGAGYVLLVAGLLRRSRRGADASFAVAVLAVVAGVSVHALATHVTFNTQPMYVLAALVGWTLARRQVHHAPRSAEGYRPSSAPSPAYTSRIRLP